MTRIFIRDATPDDMPAILALNAIEVQYTSEMDLPRLQQLDQLSSYHRVAIIDHKVAAFLLVMREQANYRNDNFEWFCARYAHFYYIDRIVVAQQFFGMGLGTRLYRDLFFQARANNIAVVGCEYNIEPLNLASQIFHHKLGFTEVGRRLLPSGGKTVSMQIATITQEPH